MKIKLSFKNLFTATRFRLDLIAGIFVIFILFTFSYIVYNLLTEDIIFQISPVFRYLENQNNFNPGSFFGDLQKQTLFLLVVSDTIIFIISMVFFDRMVKRMLKPIEYVTKLQQSFASNVSHELRTPLSIMNMRGEILMSKIKKGENKNDIIDNNFIPEFKEGVSVILSEVSNLSNILDDLLFEARIKYSEDKSVAVNINELKDLIYKVYNNQSYLKSKDVRFEVLNKINDSNKSIKTNTLHIERIFNNLISNSFKFTNFGLVKVILEEYKLYKNNYLKIIIEDTGVGIKEEDLKMVTNRFYRGKNIENEVSGSGIGLAIVEDIIKKYN